MKILKIIIMLSLFFQSSTLLAWQWIDLWKNPDQQGAELLQKGQPLQAAQTFKNKPWQGVANYRAGNYKEALQRFRQQKTSDGYYNAGNAAAFLERFQEALDAYDKAIALNPNNLDAIKNRDIIKKLMQNQKQKNAASSPSSTSNNKEKKFDNAKPSSASNQDKKKSDEQKNSSDVNKNTESTDKQASSSKDKNATNQADNKIEQSHKENKMSSKAASGNESQENVSQDSLQGQDEKQQMFRRIVDNPGGLLRQKFLRDYLRRHRDDNTFGQGDN